ncbi:MAG: Anion transporter [Myxococcaceae bacterium]|nr:Anion transporter [Myxococcaceae bacterium]
MSHALTASIFVFTYLLIAWPHIPLLPIGRPAAALLGAVAMVAVGALSPAGAYQAIDGNTLVLLVGLMALSVFLEQAGLFARLSELAIASRMSATGLLTALVLVAGVFSAVLLNDTVCLFLTPVVCHVCLKRGLPLGPYLLALATSSNIGSAATLVGNPQNILIGSIGPLDFASYARIVAPATLAALLANALLLWLMYRRELSAAEGPQLRPQSVAPPRRVKVIPLLVAVAVVVGYGAGLHLAFTTWGGVMLLIVLSRREPRTLFGDIDWSLISFFAGLFVVVAAFAATGFPDRAWQLAVPHLQLGTAGGVAWLTGYTTLGSNLFSNVPLVMLTGPLLAKLGQPERGFALLGYVSTVAGNLTLLGSVANLIVAERARAHHQLGFMEYLRVGVISTLVSLAVGVPIVCLLTR